MLTIRLQRGGKKGQPHFRVVLQEHTEPVKREAQEILGYYDPALNPKVLKVDQERIKYWISMGARPSDSLAVLLKKEGMEGMDKFIELKTRQRKKKGEQPEEAAPVAAAEAVAPAEPASATEAPVVEEVSEAPAAEEAQPAEAEAPAKPEAPVAEPAPAEPAPADEPKPE